jgi:hypothetical protein
MGSNKDLGFKVKEQAGAIPIFHNGRKATTLRGSLAECGGCELM